MRSKSRAARSLGGDAGIIVNWILRLLLILLIIGLVVYEGGAVIYGNFSADSVASDAAGEANFVYRDTRSVAEAIEAAQEIVAQQRGVVLCPDCVVVDTSARRTTVTVTKKASTLFIHNIPPLRKYTEITATESKPFPS